MKTCKYHDNSYISWWSQTGIIVKKLRVSKGFQVTLPSETRKQHRLEPGDEVVWVDTGREIFIRPLTKEVRLTDLVGRYETEEFDVVQEHDEVISGEH